MRPINKVRPTEEEFNQRLLMNRRTRGWNDNRTLQSALVDTIDHYCSFCELPINVGDHVEDKRVPRQGQTMRFSDWEHVLLACHYCQTYRQEFSTNNLNDYLWPDRDSTFTLDTTSPFVYSYKDVNVTVGSVPVGTVKLAVVEANPLSAQHAQAQRTIILFQLNTPDYDVQTNTLHLRDGTIASHPDQRLFFRTQAWEVAQRMIDTINQAQGFTVSTAPYDIALRSTPLLAQTYGFWSVWMTAFWQAYENRDLLERLFVTIDDTNSFMIRGYQGIPREPEDRPVTKRRRLNKPPTRPFYMIFTGTEAGRITYPSTNNGS